MLVPFFLYFRNNANIKFIIKVLPLASRITEIFCIKDKNEHFSL